MYVGQWPPLGAQTSAGDQLTQMETGLSQTAHPAGLAKASRPPHVDSHVTAQYSDASNKENADHGSIAQNELWWSGATGSTPNSGEPAQAADKSAYLDQVTGSTNETVDVAGVGERSEDPRTRRPFLRNWLNGLDPCVLID